MTVTMLTDLVMILIGIGLGNIGKIFGVVYSNYLMRKEIADLKFREEIEKSRRSNP